MSDPGPQGPLVRLQLVNLVIFEHPRYNEYGTMSATPHTFYLVLYDVLQVFFYSLFEDGNGLLFSIIILYLYTLWVPCECNFSYSFVLIIMKLGVCFISSPCHYVTGELIKHIPSFCDTGPRSAVGNVSGNRCESDCRSSGREFNPGPVPYLRGD